MGIESCGAGVPAGCAAVGRINVEDWSRVPSTRIGVRLLKSACKDKVQFACDYIRNHQLSCATSSVCKVEPTPEVCAATCSQLGSAMSAGFEKGLASARLRVRSNKDARDLRNAEAELKKTVAQFETKCRERACPHGLIDVAAVRSGGSLLESVRIQWLEGVSRTPHRGHASPVGVIKAHYRAVAKDDYEASLALAVPPEAALGCPAWVFGASLKPRATGGRDGRWVYFGVTPDRFAKVRHEWVQRGEPRPPKVDGLEVMERAGTGGRRSFREMLDSLSPQCRLDVLTSNYGPLMLVRIDARWFVGAIRGGEMMTLLLAATVLTFYPTAPPDSVAIEALVHMGQHAAFIEGDSDAYALMFAPNAVVVRGRSERATAHDLSLAAHDLVARRALLSKHGPSRSARLSYTDGHILLTTTSRVTRTQAGFTTKTALGATRRF